VDKDNVDVQIKMLTPEDAEVLTVSMRNISCHMSALDWTFKQLSFPYTNGGGTADADMVGGSVSLGFRVERVLEEDGRSTPRLALASHNISMQEFTIAVDNSYLSWLYNLIASLFGQIIRDYLVQQLLDNLLAQMSHLLDTLNLYASGHWPMILRMTGVTLEELPEAVLSPEDMSRRKFMQWVILEMAGGEDGKGVPTLLEVDLGKLNPQPLLQLGLTGIQKLCDSIKTNEHVTSLGVARGALGEDGVSMVANALMHNKHIQTLDLAYNGIGARGMIMATEVVKASQSLTELDLGGNHLLVEGAAVLTEGIKASPSLTKLKLHQNSIGDDGITLLSGALMHPDCGLVDIDLRGNGIGQMGVATLCNVLRGAGATSHTNTLQSLRLGSNSIGVAGMALIADVIKSNKVLLRLDLSSNQVESMGCGLLAGALSHNCTLQELDLTGNGIDLEGITFLAEAIRRNTGLKTLALARNSIGDAGATVLAEAIRKALKDAAESMDGGSVLEDVDATCNGISPGGDGERAMLALGPEPSEGELKALKEKRGKLRAARLAKAKVAEVAAAAAAAAAEAAAAPTAKEVTAASLAAAGAAGVTGGVAASTRDSAEAAANASAEMAAEPPAEEPIIYSGILKRVLCAPMSARETVDRHFALTELYRMQNLEQPVTQQHVRVDEIMKAYNFRCHTAQLISYFNFPPPSTNFLNFQKDVAPFPSLPPSGVPSSSLCCTPSSSL
jgi:Ran GTPase-activating protein (RanGAP) involved in mRNA processing and transport